MNEDKLRKLLELFHDSDIEELEVQHSFWHGTRIRLTRSRAPSPVAPAASMPVAPIVSTAPTEPAAPAPAEKTDDGLHEVLSPMVGTFYRAASPEADPFVREGDRIESGQTLCIIEAMKIMNEIPADVQGEVVEILVGDGQPVEYNQALFKIRPS
ncbi:MAG: acetyl-CoA carboxylase biotin carboxyl carrier protein [Gemmatimonadota bacterium]|nr:acetyl-CoA carboxylase biotin carboxyl carrier protein [Gemmatimonadota bacterium]